MTLVELRDILMQERLNGRKVAVIVLSQGQMKTFFEDLTGKKEPFDVLQAYGVPVLVKSEILDLSDRV